MLYHNPAFLEACKSLDIKIKPLSDNWVLALSKNTKTFYTINSSLGLNSDTATQLATDKVATSLLLAQHHLPHVPHLLLKNPKFYPNYYSSPSDYRTIIRQASFPTILKPNQGHSGQDVTLCPNVKTALRTVKHLFHTHADLALSPYLPSPYEYRCFYLQSPSHPHGHVYLIYQKSPTPTNHWQHNLSAGASSSQPLSTNHPLYSPLSHLAVQAAHALQLNFCTIDILAPTPINPQSSALPNSATSPASTLSTPTLQVLELNASVSVYLFLTQHPEATTAAITLYQDALHTLFGTHTL